MRAGVKRLGLAVLLGGAAACGPASTVDYALDFPSEASAVESDEIDVTAFDGTAASVCPDLVERARTHQALPPSLAQTPRQNLCDFRNAPASFQLSDGWRALLVRTYSNGQLFLLGCSRFQSPAVAPVSLSLPAGVPLPQPSSCRDLSQRCGGTCP